MQTYAIRNDDWKLIYKKRSGKIIPVGLYDTKTDPQEKNNLLFTNNDIVKKMTDNVPR